MADNKTQIVITAVDQASASLQKVGGEMLSLAKAAEFAKANMAAIGGAVSVAGFAAIIGDAVKTSAALHDLSQQTGLTVETLSGLKDVAALSDTSLEQVATGAQKLVKNMSDAAGGGKEAQATFQALGVAVKNSSGGLRDVGDVYADVAKSIAAIESPTERVAAAQLAFGKSGAQLLPMLNDLATAGDLVVKVTARQAALADNVGDNWQKLGLIYSNAAKSIALEALPALDAFTESLLEQAQGTNGIRTALNDLQNDGSLKSWAEDAARAAGFVVDAFDGVVRVVKAVGITIGAAAAQASALSQGNFKGVAGIGQDWLKDLDNLASGPLFSQRLEEKLRNGIGGGDSAKRDTGSAFQSRRDALLALEDRTKSATKAADELAKLLDRINGKETGLDAGYWKDLDTLHAAYQARKLTPDEYSEAVGKLTTQQKFYQDQLKAEEEAIKARNEYLTRAVQSEAQRAESVKKASDALRDEIATIGLSANEQAAYAAAKLETAAASELAAAAELENAAALLELQGALPDVSAKYRELADARRESAEAMKEQGGLTRERGVKKAADDARKEWEKTADSINNSLTDALLRGFESGKSFAENFRDTLKNMFQTLVLRPVISAVLAPVAGGIASLLPGSATAGQGGAGGAGGLLNMASTGSNLYSAGSNLYDIGSQFFGGTMSASNAAGTIYANATKTGIDGLLSTNGAFGTAPGAGGSPLGSAMPVIGGALSAYGFGQKYGVGGGLIGGAGSVAIGGAISGAMAGTGAMAGATGALAAMGPWGWAAIAIMSILGSMNKAKVPKANFINADMEGWTQIATPFGPISAAAKHMKSGDFNKMVDGVRPIADADKLLTAFMTPEEVAAASEKIKGQGTGEVKAKNASGAIQGFLEERLDLITDAIGGWVNALADTAEGELKDVYAQTAAILAARKMVGAETLANSLLDESGKEFFRETETAASAFARMATALGTVNPVLEQINVGVLAMTASAGNAATDLVKAFGSVDAFRNSTGAYYANFFSEAERAEAQQRQLKGQVFSAFAEFGAQVPKTRTEFRALVESMDVTTESGQKAFAALMNVSTAFAAITVNADAAVAAERRAVIEARRAREAAAQASVDTVAEAVKGLRQSVASDAAIAGGIIGGIRVSADEYEQFSGFADALATARTELSKVPAEMTGAIAAIEQQIVETVRLLGEQVAPLRLRQGDAQGALAALMAGVRIPSDRYTDENGNFVAAGLNRAMLFEQARASQQLGNQASADALNIQNVGGVLASLAGITQSQEFQFALREQMAGSLGVPIQGALMDVLSGAFDFAAGAAASGYVSNGVGLARVRATGAQLSAAQTGADIDAYKAAVRNLNGAMKAGSIDAEQYQTGLDAIAEIFAATIPLVDNIEAQAERVRNASLEWGRAGLESITYYFGQIGDQVAQMAEAAAAAAEPIALATAAIGRMNSVSSVFGESASAAYYGLAGGGADGRAMLYGSMGTIGNAALVSTAAAIAAEIMTTADAARVAEQLSTQFADTQRRDASLLLDGLSAYDSGAFERSFARLNNALNKGDISTDQYRELFDLSIKTYQGTENAANDLQDAFAELRRAAKSLADELLIDKGLSPLSTPQRFAEIRRQYEETIEKARTGDLDAIGDMEGITRTMLDAARNNAGSAEEYNLFSAGTIRTLRDLEAEQPLVLNPTPLLSGRSNATEDMLKELQALRAEIAAMREANSAENVAIAKATNKTANVLDAVTTGNLTFTTEAAA